MQSSNERINELICRTCLHLDQENFDDYLKLFTEEMNYRVVTFSPELKKDMVWLDHDLSEMKHLFKMLPQHVKMPGKFFRQAAVYTIEKSKQKWNSTTSFLLIYTDLDGQSRVFAAGRYNDEIVEHDQKLLISKREVHLDTRDLAPGIHVPI
ncbi:MAG: nuclear transport factor 2 family protein [Ectothiorhodospiraceae bacterium]|nr:nuclear transport factor 2 family protein [Ectothiorhodospiraceae bacterium]